MLNPLRRELSFLLSPVEQMLSLDDWESSSTTPFENLLRFPLPERLTLTFTVRRTDLPAEFTTQENEVKLINS